MGGGTRRKEGEGGIWEGGRKVVRIIFKYGVFKFNFDCNCSTSLPFPRKG